MLNDNTSVEALSQAIEKQSDTINGLRDDIKRYKRWYIILRDNAISGIIGAVIGVVIGYLLKKMNIL